MNKRPNFLLLMTDQQRADNFGFAGHPLLKTPNLDSVANSGTWWPKFYTASPSCMANRASLMTGRMPSAHGVRYNGVPLDRDAVTFVDLLRAHGYQTALVGKSHLQCMSSDPSHVPRPAMTASKPPPIGLREARWSQDDQSDYTDENIKHWKTQPETAHQTKLPFYGFDSVAFCLGHGDVMTGHYEDWLRDQGHEPKPGAQNAEKLSEVGAPQAYKPNVPEDLYPTTFVAEQTMEKLSAFAASGEPFFLQCSFPDPHHPFTPPGKYWDMYDPNDITLPESFRQPGEDAIPPLRVLWEAFNSGQLPKRFSHQFVTGEAQAREIIARNYGQIAMVDDAIGKILVKVDELGLDQNTVVCFVSDHGEYLGDHGLFLKGPFQYQSVIRTPFLWRDPNPNYNQGRQDAIGSSIDLATTILGRADLQPFNGVQGVDLFNNHPKHRDYAYIEHTNQFVYCGFDDIISVHTYVDRQWRLSVWQGCEWGELYNLAEDPHELNNLWSDDTYNAKKTDLLIRLVHGVQDHADPSPFPMAVS